MTIRIILVGVSCVGKTTIGRLIAAHLGYPFFDLDQKIESYFGTSIERLQSCFLTDYSFRNKAAVVLKQIVTDNPCCVIACPPSGLQDAYLRVIRKTDSVTVAIEDTPENIVERITFYDIDSRPIARHLTAEEKMLYRTEIKKDITYFKTSYRRANLHANITGLDSEASAKMIEGRLAGFRTGIARNEERPERGLDT